MLKKNKKEDIVAPKPKYILFTKEKFCSIQHLNVNCKGHKDKTDCEQYAIYH